MSTLKKEDDRQSPSKPEKVVMVTSLAVTLSLLGFVLYHAATAPSGVQLESRIVGQEPTEEALWVEVLLENKGATGLLAVVVEVSCAESPPQITFQHVPAGARREAKLACPLDASGFDARIVSYEAA